MSECGGREKCVGVQVKENCECGGAGGRSVGVRGEVRCGCRSAGGGRSVGGAREGEL